jgi:hypothetical protein
MDSGKTLVAMTAIILGIASPIILAGLILWYQSWKTRLLHQTALQLAEKGQPLPPEYFLGKPSPASDLRRGLVLVGLGIGLVISLYQIEVPWGFGLIPLFMGVGYLIVWALETGKSAKP